MRSILANSFNDLYVNSSRGLKAGASLLFPRCCAVIALWHRALGFAEIFGFLFHWPKLTSDSGCPLPTLWIEIIWSSLIKNK
jgi:hypothetical protein